MDQRQEMQLQQLMVRYPQLQVCRQAMKNAYERLEETFQHGGKLLVCGNGGSASDAEHIVGELMKEFRLKRKIYSSHAETLKSIDSEMGSVLADHLQGALPAISLTGHSSLTTAFMNDALPELVFAQQVNGYGQPGDAFLGISTSGNSRNVLYAAITAKAKGLKVIGLTGQCQNRLMDFADVCIRVPEVDTFKVQELHLPVYHCLCMMLEDKFFGE